MKIIHFRRTFLPRTENFILEQLKTDKFKPVVLTHQIEANFDFDGLNIFSYTNETIPKHHICPKFSYSGKFSQNYFANILNIISRILKKFPRNLKFYDQKSIWEQSHTEKNIFKKAWSNLNYKIRRITKIEQKYFLKAITDSDAELIHVHFGPDAGYFLPVIKKAKLPLVVSFYGYDCSRFPKKFFGWGKLYLQKVFKYADKIIAISHDMKSDLIALGCPAKKITIHRWGIDLEKFKSVIPSETGIQSIDDNIDFLPETNFLSIGRLTPKKGFDILIKAFHVVKRNLPNAKLIIIGEGEERENLEKLIKNYSLENDVNLVGFIPRDEIPSLIKTCDIYVQPSIQAPDGDKEGFPTALMEIMASGKPIITTPHAGIAEIIKDNQNGLLVEEKNIEVLSNEMVMLANNKNLQNQLKKNARETTKTEFDNKKQNEKLAEIYRNIIQCHAGQYARHPEAQTEGSRDSSQTQNDKKHLLKLAALFLSIILGLSFLFTAKNYSINFKKITYFKKWVSYFEPAPVFFEDNFQKGMGYVTYWNGNYSTPESDKSLEDLAATGTQWVSIVVTQYQENIDSTEITPSKNRRTPSDEDIIHVIKKAHSLGMKVALKPHIGLNNDPQHWWGEIGTNFGGPEWDKWFTSYRKFMVHYAQLAENHQVEQFYIGNEIRTLSKRDQEWRDLANIARINFSGDLIYSAGWRWLQQITWWDAVDYIGVNAYYVLSENNDPTVEEMKDTLRKRVSELAELSDKFDRKIIFSEIGYLSIDGASKNPANWAMAKNLNIPTDIEEQADCYQTFIETFWDEPWIAGIYWWHWDTKANLRSVQYPEYKPDVSIERNYTPQDKPSEDIIKNMEIIPADSITNYISPKILYTKFWLKMKELQSYNP